MHKNIKSAKKHKNTCFLNCNKKHFYIYDNIYIPFNYNFNKIHLIQFVSSVCAQ